MAMPPGMPGGMGDMPVQVPVDDPNADTEWNDILRSKGIIPERSPSPTPMIEEALVEARRLAHENRLEGKDLDELDELEDEEDDEFLQQYRNKRMQEMSSINTASIYNQVYHLQKPDYSREVTETSKKSWVFVLLTSSHETNVESRVAIEIWRELARRFGDIKFCQMKGDLCIEGYPDKNTPTILVYKDEDIKKQIVTFTALKGPRTSAEDFDKILLELGAVKHSDARVQKREEDPDPENKVEGSTRIVRGKQATAEDEDSDWD